ncbi:MAG: HAD family hydrolase [Candidatus Binataceae bacterium]
MRDPASVRLWLFDFDNTLAALEPVVDWARSRIELEAYLREAGVAAAIFTEFPRGNLLLYEALRARLLDGMRPGLVRAHPAGADHANPDSAGERDGRGAAVMLRRASRIIEKYELAGAERACPLRGAEQLLRALAARGIRAAIVTSNSSRTVQSWLRHNRLTETVGAIVGRDGGLALKPLPAMVHEALTRVGASAHEAVFVGDSEADAGAARSARVSFYGIAAKPIACQRLRAAGALDVFASPAALAQAFQLAEACP